MLVHTRLYPQSMVPIPAVVMRRWGVPVRQT